VTVTASSDIGRAFDSYRSKVIPFDASAVQIRETRRAFYAGAQAILTAMLNIEQGPPFAPLTEADLTAGADKVEALRLELQQFVKSVGRGPLDG
jgi:hypothetical protein